MKFQNRFEAGVLLAKALKQYADKKDAIILALPRGGVVVAHPIATHLNVPLDLCLVKKLGVPFHEELAMGAIAINTEPVFNHDVLQQCDISENELNQIIFQKQNELFERNQLYRNNQPAPDVKNKIVIIVDDGIATGATLRAAIQAIKSQHPKKIVVAVPVADKSTCEEFAAIVDEVICLHRTTQLMSVGNWYDNFSQTTDEEVIQLLKKSDHSKL